MEFVYLDYASLQPEPAIDNVLSYKPWYQLTALGNRKEAYDMALGSIWARLRGNGQPSLARSTALRVFGFATWIPVIAMFNLHVAELTFVDGASMYPLINDDKDSTLRRDVILNWKWSPQENLERGMVVTLR